MQSRSTILSIILFFYFNFAWSQRVQHTYRFTGDLAVAQPECGPLLIPAKSPGGCQLAPEGGRFSEDKLACGIERTVYHNNLNWGLMYPNAEGAITNNYTIQMYMKVTNWGNVWARIIDFSNGERDEGVYFKSTPGSEDRCLNFYPSGTAGACPYFNNNTYYLLTFTRNGQTGIVDVYVDNTLFTSYDDSQGRYVGKAGIPIYIFRDDDQKTCESGEANFAYLSFTNQYFSKTDVERVYNDICYVANINSYADFSISPNPVCNLKEDVTVKYTGIIAAPGNGYTFEWDFGGATVKSGSGMGPYVISWTAGGTKEVSLKVTSKGCGNSLFNGKKIIVSALDLETATIAGDCVVGDTPVVKLKGQNGKAPYEYSTDAVHYKPDSIYTMPIGKYKGYVRDGDGCIVAKDLIVEFNGDIQVGIVAEGGICHGESVTLSATGNGQKFIWSPPASLDDPASQNPLASPSETTQYVVTASKGSCVKKDSVTVQVSPKVEVYVTPDTLIKTGVPFQLTVSSPQVTNANENTFLWSPPEGLNSQTISNPVAILQEDQTYTVDVIADNGCRGTGKVTLTIERYANIFMPTAFTPNNDGKNDILTPIFSAITSLHYYKIFNRWGQMIFYTNEMDTGWDGFFQGTSAVSDNYVWEIEGVSSKGKVVRKTGSVILLK